ncbi:MAG TPA: PKD domain-containing protein [Candidatus Paceibacterota bacterium]|nr:PKD domain-containing protein [Candidatus Paceibacterota bacterium]
MNSFGFDRTDSSSRKYSQSPPRLWLVLLMIVLLFAAGPVVSSALAQPAVAHDVNGDGVIDMLDAIKALNLAARVESPGTRAQALAADYDGNGQISSFDVLSILRMHVGIYPKLTVSASQVHGVAPLEVAFAANVTGGEPPHVVEWDFAGDGDFDAQGENVQRVFATDAVYQVTARVADHAGHTTRITLPITVHSVAPAAVEDITVNVGDSFAHLSWLDARFADDELLGYNLYRAEPGDPEFRRLNVAPLQHHYWDRSLENGVPYTYRLLALGLNGLEGPPSDDLVAIPGATLQAVRLISAVPGDGQVRLTWEAVAGATGYRIYRYPGSAVRFAETLATGAVDDLSYLDSTPANGTLFSYRVEAIDALGRNGGSANSMRVAAYGAADRDRDGLPDDWEHAWGTDEMTDDADLDPDSDTLTHRDEFAARTDPFDFDTDDDGLTDGAETAQGADPLRSDSDGGGEGDGLEVSAGTSPADPHDDALRPPTLLAADLDGETIELTWMAADSPHVEGYHVYADRLDGLGFVRLNSSLLTACRLGGIEPTDGHPIKFVVTSLRAGQESRFSRSLALLARRVEGGTGADLEFFGDRLTVPPASFTGTRWLALAECPEPSPLAASGRILSLLPHGAVFDAPVILRRPLALPEGAEDLIGHLRFAYAAGEWTSTTATAQPETGSVLRIETDHFSAWYLHTTEEKELEKAELRQKDGTLNLTIKAWGGIPADSTGAKYLEHLSRGFSALQWLQDIATANSETVLEQIAQGGFVVDYIKLYNLLYRKCIDTRCFKVQVGSRTFYITQEITFETPTTVAGGAEFDQRQNTIRVKTTVQERRDGDTPVVYHNEQDIKKGDLTWERFLSAGLDAYQEFTVPFDIEGLGLEPGDRVSAKVTWTDGRNVSRKDETEIRPWPLGPTLTGVAPPSEARQDVEYALELKSLFTPADGKHHRDYTVTVEAGPFKYRYPQPIRGDQWIRWTPVDWWDSVATDIAHYDQGLFPGWDELLRGRGLHRRRPLLCIADAERNSRQIEWDLRVINRPDPPTLDFRTPTSSNTNRIAVYRTRPVNLKANFIDFDLWPEAPELLSGQTYENGVSVFWDTLILGTLSNHKVEHDRATGQIVVEATYTAPDMPINEDLWVALHDPENNEVVRADFFLAVLTPPPPALSISGPGSLYTGQSGTFYATVSDPESWKAYSTASFNWSGASRGSYSSSSKQCSASFSRSSAGAYTVACTVTDQFGQTASASRTVSVVDTPPPPPPEGSGAGNVTVSSQLVTIRVWDNAAEDGDIIDLYVNGAKRLGNHTLTKSGTSIEVWLNRGHNTLKIVALNVGTDPPNTASVSISNVTNGPSNQTWNAYQGAYAQCTITFPFY